jgi:hypothetical protein
MPKVKFIGHSAGDNIDDVEFVRIPGGVESVEITDEQVERFLRIPGFELVVGAPVNNDLLDHLASETEEKAVETAETAETVEAVAKNVIEPVVEPVAETVAEPVAEVIVETVAEPVIEQNAAVKGRKGK